MKFRMLSGLIFAAACGGMDPSVITVENHAEFSALQYPDTGQVSLNGWCSNTGLPLNLEIEPLYANGSPIGFC